MTVHIIDKAISNAEKTIIKQHMTKINKILRGKNMKAYIISNSEREQTKELQGALIELTSQLDVLKMLKRN